MGLLKWIKTKIYPPAMVADNAVTQFKKYESMGMAADDIPSAMWAARFMRGMSTLDQKMLQRFERYLEADFECLTMIDFCLGSLDIELFCCPADQPDYDRKTEYICNELVSNRVPFKQNDIVRFKLWWLENIYITRTLDKEFVEVMNNMRILRQMWESELVN